MLITDHFVLLNFPKTGSTFARKILKDIYIRRAKRNLFLKAAYRLKLIKIPFIELYFTHYYYKKMGKTLIDQHGTYSQIPNKYLDRQVVSIIRNPYERLLSLYEFKFWKTNPELNKDIIELHFPHFPNLSINDYIDYLKLVNKEMNFNGSDNVKIGIFTVQFLFFYFKNPESVLLKMNDEYLKSDILFKKDLVDIKFLKQENLKEDLIKLLKEYGFSESEITFIKDHERVNITKDSVDNRNELYTDKLIRYIEEEEFFLIKILKEIGFHYEKPNLNYK